MGITEELNELNKRLNTLVEKRESLKSTLAVEEHKVGELVESLGEEGYDVSKMSIDELNELLKTLTDGLTKGKGELEENIKKAEDLYSKFDELK